MDTTRIWRPFSRLMLIDEVRVGVAWLRYFWLVRIRRRLRIEHAVDGSTAENTIEHNLSAVRRSVLRNGRTNALIRPLSVIPKIQWRLPEATVLSVGPRSETDLLNLVAHGFRWQSITGIDLITYSPRIKLGDMHNMPFADDSFDVVVASRVLGYSETPGRAAAEFIRVSKPGGLVAINSGDRIVTRAGAYAKDYRAGARQKLGSLDELLNLFGDAVGEVFFRNDPSNLTGEHRGPLLAIFEIRKPSR